jgi:hypothetical protein
MEILRSFLTGFRSGFIGLGKRVATAMILLAVIESMVRVVSGIVQDVNKSK